LSKEREREREARESFPARFLTRKSLQNRGKEKLFLIRARETEREREKERDFIISDRDDVGFEREHPNGMAPTNDDGDDDDDYEW